MFEYTPAVDSYLTVMLPGELMRCRVVRLVDQDRVLIEIEGVPMSKQHQYRKGDRTGARRRIDYGREIWEALDDRDFLANRSPAALPEPEPEPVVKEKKMAKSKDKPAKRKLAPKKKAKAAKKQKAAA